MVRDDLSDSEDEQEVSESCPPSPTTRERTLQTQAPSQNPEPNVHFRGSELSKSPTMVTNGLDSDASKLSSRKDHSTRTMTGASDRTALSGIERFRASVRKIMHMHRGYSAIMGPIGIGSEPGVDPRKAASFAQYGHINAKCRIEVADYSSSQSTFRQFGNKEFLEFLSRSDDNRGSWVKVRWMHISGLSWDVLSALALTHDMHPLALEDILHNRSKSRSKSDYFIQHLFIRVLCHTLMSEGVTDIQSPPAEVVVHTITNLPRSQSPLSENGRDQPEEEEEEKANEDEFGYDVNRDTRSRSSTLLRKKREHIANTIRVEDLKKDERVMVATIPLFICLFRNGTVISVCPQGDVDFTNPIVNRLRQRESMLRTTPDASMLVQSLLDLVVDKALEVVDAYHEKILSLEHQVLIRPKMKTVRRLHIISGDLTLHQTTLDPIKTLVYGLRRYDVDRCAALMAGKPASEIKGYLSHKSKIYLADVHDHIDHVLRSLDTFASITENLIDYTFNMANYEMSETIKRLTYVTIIFLPLTLLAGYFGMNFNPRFWSVHNNSDLFYWEIAIPMTIVIVSIFMYSDLGRLAHFIDKRWKSRQLAMSMKQKQL